MLDRESNGKSCDNNRTLTAFVWFAVCRLSKIDRLSALSRMPCLTGSSQGRGRLSLRSFRRYEISLLPRTSRRLSPRASHAFLPKGYRIRAFNSHRRVARRIQHSDRISIDSRHPHRLNICFQWDICNLKRVKGEYNKLSRVQKTLNMQSLEKQCYSPRNIWVALLSFSFLQIHVRQKSSAKLVSSHQHWLSLFPTLALLAEHDGIKWIAYKFSTR